MAAYTNELTLALVNGYNDAEDKDTFLADFAEKYGKSIPSVRAKLVREKVYISKESAPKKRVKKDDLVNQIEVALNGIGELEGFEKLTASQLRTLLRLVEAK